MASFSNGTSYTWHGLTLAFVVGVIFWTGFVYSQVTENTRKIDENKKEVKEVSEISDDVTEIQVKQEYIQRDVSEIKELLQRMVRDNLGNNS